MKKTTECSFLTLILSVKKTSLPLLSTANQLLAELIPIFDSFLPSSYKIGLLHTLLYRCFRICSDWTKFHLELVKLIDVFKSNGYPENFINNCFKVFLDNKYRVKEKVITVHKKTLFLVLPYLGPVSLQTRKYLKGNISKVFLIVASYRLCLKVKTN